MTADDFDYDGDEAQAGSANPNIAKLRERGDKAEQKAKDAEKRAEQAERRLAFAEAGLDLSDKKVKYFIAGYDGDMDAEKIKSAAIEDGFLPDPEAQKKETEESQEQQPHPEAQGFNAMEDATGGAGQNASPVDLRKGMMEIYENGGDTEQVAAFLASQGHPVTTQD